MKENKIDIGIEVPQPNQKCSDLNCPFHGYIKVRGRIFTGKVIRDVLHKTATIEFSRQHSIPKYERYEKRRTRLKAHVPPCLDVKHGDIIRIMETRPISKSKNFVTIEILKNESNKS